ncbi:MAG: MlaE family lipid ABC transporter permease subunit [Rhodospirillaceae bacterium]|nr:MlaE family lipid ABC transporter permease subunit [Rhodospirillaceae bacterium]
MTDQPIFSRPASFEIDGHSHTAKLAGSWTMLGLSQSVRHQIDTKMSEVLNSEDIIAIDCTGIEQIDTAGVLLIQNFQRNLEKKGKTAVLNGLAETKKNLFEQLDKIQPLALEPTIARKHRLPPFMILANQAGYQIFRLGKQSLSLVSFFGYVLIRMGVMIVHPSRLRWTALASHLDRTGFQALPIVGLLSFLIGIVLSFQGVDQLSQWGAAIFTVNLVALSMTREMGVLITAILVAGRSGSSFTAEIGAMKINEEVDAIKTLGLNPIDVLVLPRLLALVIVLPLLTFFANFMGIMGGGVMLWVLLGIEPANYINLVRGAISHTGFWLGIIKAPVFAFFIGLISCFHGMLVKGSTEEVGSSTTRAVVESIFYVIMLDAVFSIIFSILKI